MGRDSPTPSENHTAAVSEYARISLEFAMLAATGMKEHGQQVLRTIFAMNGSGILATLTFVGAFANSGDQFEAEKFVLPLSLFAIGVLLSPVAMFVAYMNYHHNYLARIDLARRVYDLMLSRSPQMEIPAERIITRPIRLSLLGAVGACILSMLLFGAGCYYIGRVFAGDA